MHHDQNRGSKKRKLPGKQKNVNFAKMGGIYRPSHLRRAIFGPSKWPVLRGSVRAISGLSNRQTANRHRLPWPLHYRTCLYLFLSLARLLNAVRANFGPPGIFKWEGLGIYKFGGKRGKFIHFLDIGGYAICIIGLKGMDVPGWSVHVTGSWVTDSRSIGQPGQNFLTLEVWCSGTTKSPCLVDKVHGHP